MPAINSFIRGRSFVSVQNRISLVFTWWCNMKDIQLFVMTSAAKKIKLEETEEKRKTRYPKSMKGITTL